MKKRWLIAVLGAVCAWTGIWVATYFALVFLLLERD